MRRRTRAVAVALGALVALAVPACGGGDSGEGGQEAKQPPAGGPLSGEAPVRIIDFEFKPKKVVVKPGTTVTWTNGDTSIHDIKDTSPLATPISPEMSKGDTFSITYAQPGNYSYICGIHPYMSGTVEVVP